MPGTASYQMYAWPQTKASAQRFWTLIRAAYGSGNEDLTEFDDPEQAWTDPDLLLSQTCGLPYRYRLHGTVTLLGTLDYGVTGCAPGYYRSCLVVHKDDPRTRPEDYCATPIARNSIYSQSGWAALEQYLTQNGADIRNRAQVIDTGSHANSARAVAEGKAGLASLDAVTWRFLQRYDPHAKNLRVLARTDPTPGLPLITGRAVDPGPLYDAIDRAIADLPAPDAETLGIKGIVRIPASAYLAEPLPCALRT